MKDDIAQKFANILRVDKVLFEKTIERLVAATGKTDVLERIFEEDEKFMQNRLWMLGVHRDAHAKEIYDGLISKIESDDHLVYEGLGRPVCKKVSDCQGITDLAKKVANPPKGFCLKLDKAREFLIKEPPKKVMEFLGYTAVEEMLKKEDLLEVYSALRFIEGSEWLNAVFFKQYETLTPADFEEREIEVKALSEKWGVESQKFVAKKKHNISHLKELGVIFVIPTFLGISGEILRMFALLMHYLQEVPFYSDMFRTIAKDEATFTQNLVSLLRGDVLSRHIDVEDKSVWLVVQRYLAKDDPNDWRLFVPHINPEALHWLRATRTLAMIGDRLDHFSDELNFWSDLDWVGDYFKDESGVPVLVSFNLVDTVMSLVKEKEMVKYLYHHEEALWNRIFVEFFGEDKLVEYSKQYLLKGYFEI
jgi:hypothetical protein